jgi:hypothetical protein
LTESTEPRILNGGAWERKEFVRRMFEADSPGTCMSRNERAHPLILPYALFVERLNVMIRVELSAEQGLYPVLYPQDATADFAMEIWDISNDGRVIIGWPTAAGYWTSETISCSPEQVAWLKRRWKIEYRFNEALKAELERAQLSKWGVEMRRRRVLEDAELNDAAVQRKREEALRRAKMDEASVEAQRQEVQARVRLQFPETDEEPIAS